MLIVSITASTNVASANNDGIQQNDPKLSHTEGHGGIQLDCIHQNDSKLNHTEGHHGGIHLANWLLGILFVVLVVILLKIAFHHAPLLAEWTPESVILIVVGLITGQV